jgi:hypothetical protein
MDDGAINTALPFKGGRDTIIINGKGSYKLFKKSKNLTKNSTVKLPYLRRTKSKPDRRE